MKYLEYETQESGPTTHTEEHNHEPATHTEEEFDESDVEAYLSSFPPGYRFQPLDEELIIDYLQPKINGEPLPQNMIHDVHINDYTPEQLAAMYKAQGGKRWYFFSSRDRKYPNGRRPDRKAGDGYWKATSKDKSIIYQDKQVGHKMTLVFYKGKPPKGIKTSWIMYEFRILDPPQNTNKRKMTSTKDTNMRLDGYVLCSIHKKEEDKSQSREQHEVQEDAPIVQTQEVETSSIDIHSQLNNTLPNIYHENAIPTVNHYSNNGQNLVNHNDVDARAIYNYPQNYNPCTQMMDSLAMMANDTYANDTSCPPIMVDALGNMSNMSSMDNSAFLQYPYMAQPTTSFVSYPCFPSMVPSPYFYPGTRQ